VETEKNVVVEQGCKRWWGRRRVRWWISTVRS
jgi:hypothetical protein